jgi:hypothetical protein
MDAVLVRRELLNWQKQKRYKGHIYSVKTLQNIIIAGREGCLDLGISKTS